MSDIIGMRFKRNKYGLSIWEDRIVEIMWHREYEKLPGKPRLEEILERLKNKGKMGFTLVPKVLGKNTLKAYDLNEIIVYND